MHLVWGLRLRYQGTDSYEDKDAESKTGPGSGRGSPGSGGAGRAETPKRACRAPRDKRQAREFLFLMGRS